MKSTRTVISVVSILFLAGCQMNMEADLYSSDIRSAADGGQEIRTPATLFLPVTSVDKCEEQTTKIVAIMKGIVGSFQPKGCKRQGMDSYMLADMQLPVLATMAAWKKTDALFGFVSQHPKDSSNIDVFVMMNRQAYQTLKKRVRAEFHQSLDLKKSTFTLVLNNDEREDIYTFVEHAFVNGQSALHGIHDTPRRKKITISLSNVSVGFLEKNGGVPAFRLLAGEKP